MLEIAVKCIGWLWRARAILSNNCFDTLAAVVVSYAATARSNAIGEAQPVNPALRASSREQAAIRDPVTPSRTHVAEHRRRDA